MSNADRAIRPHPSRSRTGRSRTADVSPSLWNFWKQSNRHKALEIPMPCLLPSSQWCGPSPARLPTGGIICMHFINAVLFIAMALSSVLQESYSTEWNKKSTLSTDKQVEFPGIVLEPGIYIIRLKEGGERRSIVEIRNRDETQVLATLLAVPDHQQRPDDNS